MNRYAPRLIDTRTHIHICSKICLEMIVVLSSWWDRPFRSIPSLQGSMPGSCGRWCGIPTQHKCC